MDTAGNLEADFADGSIGAGVRLAKLYIFSQNSTQQTRGAKILMCLLRHSREAHRLMAFCFLYGVGIPRDIQASKDLLRNI